MVKGKYLIITRPFSDAERTAALLANVGIESFIEPSISVEIIPQAQEKLIAIAPGADGIVITSLNALHALKEFNYSSNTKIISVGKETSSLAKEYGFANVEFGGENVASLLEYIKLNYTGKRLIYASGTTITTQLSQENCGAYISRIEVYHIIPAEKISQLFRQKLKAGDFYGAAFFSSNTARIFCNLLKNENLHSHIKSLIAFCFSDKIKSDLKDYGFKATISSKNANLEAFCKLLSNFNLHK